MITASSGWREQMKVTTQSSHAAECRATQSSQSITSAVRGSDRAALSCCPLVPPPAAGKHYEVWVLRQSRGGAMEAVGAFTPDGSHVRLKLGLPGAGDYELLVRATDDQDRTQPSQRATDRADEYELNSYQRIRIVVI